MASVGVNVEVEALKQLPTLNSIVWNVTFVKTVVETLWSPPDLFIALAIIGDENSVGDSKNSPPALIKDSTISLLVNILDYC